MRKFPWILFALAMSCAAIATAADQDMVLAAMRDELHRAMSLSLQQLDKPYYGQYVIDDLNTYTASASLGGLINSRNDRSRIPAVKIRVGDYSFDNTNWVGSDFSGGTRYATGSFPLDADYATLRRFLWLETDSDYKGSLQAIARKRAALANVSVTDQLPDFSPAPKVQLLRDAAPIAFQPEPWVERTRKISGIFNSYPDLRYSQAEYSVVTGMHRFVNTEGSEVRTSYAIGSFQIRASAQAADGMVVRDAAIYYTRDVRSMFPEAELQQSAKVTAENVTKLVGAPVGDTYSGPVLFEGVASAQLLAQLLGTNLHIARKPVPSPGQPAQAATTELEGRRGVRIMPEMFDVVDDPTLGTLQGHGLFGKFEVDDEAVAPKKLQLIEKGVLKDFLRTRQPVRGYSDSNGRARLAGSFGANTPAPSNLIVQSRETTPLPELKKKLIDICQQRGLAFGILVRKLDFPSTASIEEARKILSNAGAGGSTHPISVPLLVYRVYPDGREELIRGMRFRSLNARSLKDILLAGNDPSFFNYLENGAPFAFLGAGNSVAEISIVAPSVLMDDVDLSKGDDDLPKLPIVPSPHTTATANKPPQIARTLAAR